MLRLKKKSSDLNPDVTGDSSKKRSNDGDDDDIFTELLAGASASVAALKQKPKQPYHASNCMTTIDVRSAVLFEPGLRIFIPAGDKVVCCRAIEQGYVLSMFYQISPNSGLDTLAYEALPRLTTVVEVSAVSLQGSRQSCYKNYGPQLMCVQPGGSVSSLPSCAAVERSLFKKLFNSDASLLDSPVIIFGGQDGQIYFWTVNSFALTSMSSQEDGAKQAFMPQLLYHLEQGVSAIYTANLDFQETSKSADHASAASDSGSSEKQRKKQSRDYSNAVVFVGERDKVLIASEKKASSDKGRTGPVNFTEHTILGPVICSSLNSPGDTLIHSTGKEIFITKLDIYGENIATTTTVLPTVLTTIDMQLPNVCALCCINKKSKTDRAVRQDEVYALTFNGKLLLFPLPESRDGNSFIDANISPQKAGEKVKSYLSEIEAQSAELAKVNATIEMEDKILKELNTAIHFSCQMSEGTEASGPLETDPNKFTVPLACTFIPTLASYDSSGNISTTLHCKIVNQGKLPLSSYWSLMVRIQGKEPWLHQITGESCTLGQSVPLMDFNPGSFLEVDIPLSKSLSSSFHIVAEADLYCNLKLLLADLSVNLKKPVEDVVIPIKRQVLDILYFVKPNQIGSQGGSGPNVVPDSKEELLQILAKLDLETQRLMHMHDLSGDNEAVNTEETFHGSYSATFHISQDAVSFMNLAIQSNLAQQTAQVTTQQTTVLRFILKDSSVSDLQIVTGFSSVDLLTVNGSRVSIHVRPVSSGTASAHSPPLEVLLHCSSVRLLCCLHEAVLTRLKVS